LKHDSGKFSFKLSYFFGISYKMYLCLRLYSIHFSVFHMALGFKQVWMLSCKLICILQFIGYHFLYTDHCPSENNVEIYVLNFHRNIMIVSF